MDFGKEEDLSEQSGSEQDWSDDDIPIDTGGLITDFLCLRQRINPSWVSCNLVWTRRTA